MTEKNFTAEIISIGDEITSGALTDTNSAWLSTDLTEHGIRTLYHTTIGDEMVPMTTTFRIAASRSGLIIISGGIGPTEDDLTRQAVAEAFGRELVFDEPSFEHIKNHFAKRKRFMPDSNRIQACFPKGAVIIPNPHGTAPGFYLDGDRADFGLGIGRFRLFVFPGVPAEMKEMWIQTGRDRALELEKEITGRPHYVLSRRIQCFGLGESELESKLPHLIARDHVPTVGITVKEGIMTLRIRAEGDSVRECQRQIEETRSVIYNILGEVVFGEEDDTLSGVIAAKLRKSGKKVAVFEWGTRGLLASRLAPEIFVGGRIFSQNDSIGEKELIECVRRFAADNKADYLLMVGPYPDQAKDDQENKTVLVGVYDASAEIFHKKEIVFGGHPAMIDSLFASRILDLLRLIL